MSEHEHTPAGAGDAPSTAPAAADGRAGPDGAADIEPPARHDALPHTRASVTIDRLIRRVGDAASWLWIALIGVIVVNVTMRYVFSQGSVLLEEAQWHLYAVGFLVGLSYALQSDDHVRVDVVAERLSVRARCWIELYGIALLLLPFVALVLIYAVPFIADSYRAGERSQSPGGLPYRYVIKAFLFVGFALLPVAALSRLSRVCALLFGAPRAVPPPADPGRAAPGGD